MNNTLIGIHENMSNADYHAADGISSTGLAKIINQTPAHYRAYKTEPRFPTPAMTVGTAAHMAILEPKLFKSTYTRKPDGMSFATIEGKAWRSANSGKEILSADDFDKVMSMANSVASHPTAQKLVNDGIAEQSFFWVDEKTGVLCKCRPDYMVGSMLVDVKTTESASERDFQRNIVNLNYGLQTAYYLRGVSAVTGKNFTDMVHLVIEKNAPFAISLFSLDDASIEKANELIDMGLARYAECLKTDSWPGYPEAIIPTAYPSWAF